ncbi:MAG TPA: hypothetical protein VGL09_09835 [Methylomirabilota bacterium]
MFVGALLGRVLGDPKRLGADFTFTAIFIALIVSLCGGPRNGGALRRARRRRWSVR